ncbi:MAG: DNA polymerase subunit beta [Candidatus Hecatellales archaeon]|nr:MAG: DNA polymerase subunit beta [Candidatus Hecatellales archaeon]
MSRIRKPVRLADLREVAYDEARWRLLESLRLKAERIMKVLEDSGLGGTLVHGSLARGDVDRRSDVDVVIPYPVSSFQVEVALEKAGLQPVDRLLVQATPRHVVKAHLYLDELTTVTFPLIEFSRLEREFYKFGGEVGLRELQAGVRVPGIDKRLMLILPTARGHQEVSVVGREAEAAGIVGVSPEMVGERVRVLLRRDSLGRTGVYLKYRLKPGETFEEALRRLASEDPAIRRMLKQRING